MERKSAKRWQSTQQAWCLRGRASEPQTSDYRVHILAAMLCCSSPTALQLSLSRLNHWLPWGQTDSEVMQGTTEFHHEIADAVLPQPDAVFHNAAALDAAIDMLDP